MLEKKGNTDLAFCTLRDNGAQRLSVTNLFPVLKFLQGKFPLNIT